MSAIVSGHRSRPATVADFFHQLSLFAGPSSAELLRIRISLRHAVACVWLAAAREAVVLVEATCVARAAEVEFGQCPARGLGFELAQDGAACAAAAVFGMRVAEYDLAFSIDAPDTREHAGRCFGDYEVVGRIRAPRFEDLGLFVGEPTLEYRRIAMMIFEAEFRDRRANERDRRFGVFGCCRADAVSQFSRSSHRCDFGGHTLDSQGAGRPRASVRNLHPRMLCDTTLIGLVRVAVGSIFRGDLGGDRARLPGIYVW